MMELREPCEEPTPNVQPQRPLRPDRAEPQNEPPYVPSEDQPQDEPAHGFVENRSHFEERAALLTALMDSKAGPDDLGHMISGAAGDLGNLIPAATPQRPISDLAAPSSSSTLPTTSSRRYWTSVHR